SPPLHSFPTRRSSDLGRTIGYDALNRPVTVNGVTYTYDADGARLSMTSSGTTTTYFGDDFEVTNGTTTKYLRFAGRRVAKKVGRSEEHTSELQSLTNL